MLGAAFMAVTMAGVGCTTFGAENGSGPASVPDDAGAADGARGTDGAPGVTDAAPGVTDAAPAPNAKACAPFQCPAGAIVCEDFETLQPNVLNGWSIQQELGGVSAVEECTGKAMAGNVNAASSAETRKARVTRFLNTPERREFFLDFDAWVEPKGAFTKSGFGSFLAIGAVNGNQTAGYVGLSFGVDGLAAVVRNVGADVNRLVSMRYGTWVHVRFHVKFAESKGLVEVAFDGERATSVEAKTLNGDMDGISLQIGALTEQDATPALTVKIDNVVLR
jgi:hypothetical protein